MKKLTLWGYYGFGNVGDEALLDVCLSLMKDAKVDLLCGPAPSVRASEKLSIVPRSPENLYKSIRSSDGFVLGAGGLIHERAKPLGTYYHLLGPFISKYSRKPYCAIGQQIGPFQRNLTKMLAKKALERARFITVRDNASQVEASFLGLNTTLSADLAFLLNPEDPSVEVKKAIESMPKPRIIFAPASYMEETPSPEFCAKVLGKIISLTGGSLIIIPFFPGKDDEFGEKAESLLPPEKVLRLKSPVDWRDAFGAFNLCDFSVPMRLHSVIASSLACVPALPMPYFQKVRSISSEIGYNTMIEKDDPDWEQKCLSFLSSSQNICQQTALLAKDMRNRAKVTAKLMEDFIGDLERTA
ncbi:MAG TPA: polysaccharide pyruvyl transferase family protein [Caldisericia bacterium]|nr:polysaccharide pyruvyl transferase family protein [Caldisericia bacterium]